MDADAQRSASHSWAIPRAASYPLFCLMNYYLSMKIQCKLSQSLCCLPAPNASLHCPSSFSTCRDLIPFASVFISPDLLRPILIYAFCPGRIIASDPLTHSKVPGLGDKLQGSPTLVLAWILAYFLHKIVSPW